MGYTPVFDSIYTGTLYGKWPAAAVWASLLPLMDQRGELNLSFEAIAGMTGWPMDLLRAGIDQLEQPDPGSRTDAEEGRRLVRLDSRRAWGWRAVNHGKYREKARRAAYDAERTASGRDAERKRAERQQSRPVPPCPTDSRDVPLSDSDTDSTRKTRAREKPPEQTDAQIFARIQRLKTRYPESARADWIVAERHCRSLLDEGEATWDELDAAVDRMAAHCRVTGRLVMNPARFFGEPDRPWAQAWSVPTRPDPDADRRDAKRKADWQRVRAYAADVGCTFEPRDYESPEAFETRVKLWARDQPRAPAAPRSVAALLAGKDAA